MKIALIMTKGYTYSFRNRSALFKYMPDSLTLGMLHAIVKNSIPDIDVEIYDETVEIVKKEKIDADLVGISAITPAYNRAKEYAKYFKSKNIPVFIGGAHASLCPEKCVEDFDSVIAGLANDSLVELINDFLNPETSMKKIYEQKKDMSFENFVFPSRKIYEEKHPLATELNMVQATYGCTNVCEFCVQPYVCYGYHKRPVEDVVEEIKLIEDDYVEFVDPNLAKDTDYLKELCQKLMPLKKNWFAPMTISIVKDEELLGLLQKAGCEEVLIGFESISDESVASIKKGFNRIDDYKKAVRKLHDYGIKVTGSFVLGLDGDDENTVKNTLEFINDAHIDFVRFTINTPYPGTAYYEKMKEDGRIITEDLSLYDCHHCVILPKKITPEKVEEMQRTLWKKAYSLKSVCKRLSYIKSFSKRIKAIVKNYCFGRVYLSMVLRKQFV